MRDVLLNAVRYAEDKVGEIRPDELPFELQGEDRCKWYYTEVEQHRGSVLTWEHILITYKGLMNCAYRQQLYRDIYFEIWEMEPGAQQGSTLGVGEFGVLWQKNRKNSEH